jgi:hypothetical protein
MGKPSPLTESTASTAGTYMDISYSYQSASLASNGETVGAKIPYHPYQPVQRIMAPPPTIWLYTVMQSWWSAVPILVYITGGLYDLSNHLLYYVILLPLQEIYFRGPTLNLGVISIGGWGGADMYVICSSLVNNRISIMDFMSSEKSAEACRIIIDKHVYSIYVCIISALWLGVCVYCLLLLRKHVYIIPLLLQYITRVCFHIAHRFMSLCRTITRKVLRRN